MTNNTKRGLMRAVIRNHARRHQPRLARIDLVASVAVGHWRDLVDEKGRIPERLWVDLATGYCVEEFVHVPTGCMQ